MKPIRSWEEFERRYYPKDAEKRRWERMTPEERGVELARRSLKRAFRGLKLV